MIHALPRAAVSSLGLGLALILHLATEPIMAGVVASGTFQSKEAGLIAAGAFEIHEDGGRHTLVVKSDFKVSEGPDLFFAFHPLASAAITGSNAKTNALRVDPMLRSLSGAQTYEIPAGFDPSRYRSLVIHCWKYNHLYAAGTLNKAGNPSALEAAPKAEPKPAARRLERRGGSLLLKNGDGKKPVDASGRQGSPEESLRNRDVR